jgi:hypothetical protein
MNNSLNIKTGINIEPSTATPTANGDVTCDTTGNLRTVSGAVITETNTLTLTNKTLTSPVVTNFTEVAETTTPSTPSAGRRRFYAKNDGFYQVDSNGIESSLATGSSGSRKNYLSGYSFDSVVPAAITTYTEAAAATPTQGSGSASSIVTLSRTTSSPLSGAGSLRLTKSAINGQGHGVNFGSITIDRQDRTKVLEFSFDYEQVSGTYNFGTGTYSDLILYIAEFDGTTWTAREPAPIKIDGGLAGVALTAKCSFQVNATTTQIRPLIHVATNSVSAYAFSIDNLFLGRQEYEITGVVSDWQTYTPAITTNDLVTVIGSNTATAQWRRVGSNLEVRGRVNYTGTPSFGTFRVHLPSGLRLNTALVPLPTESPIGLGSIVNNGTNYACEISPAAETAVFMRIHASFTGTNIPVARNFGYSSTSPQPISANDIVHFEFSMPIAGWSSPQLLASDNDGRVLAVNAYKNDQTVNTNASAVKLLFQTPTIDTHGAFNNSRFTAPSNGTYAISGQVTIAGTNVVVGSEYAVDIFRNGVFFAGSASLVATTNAIGLRIALPSHLLRLNSGDFVELFLTTSANHSVNNITVAAFGSHFAVQRLSGTSVPLPGEKIVVAATADATVQTLTSGAATPIVYQTKTEDTHNAYNNTTGTFTVPVAGVYTVSASTQIITTATNQNHITQIWVNGVVTRIGSSLIPTTASTSVANCTLVRSLRAGETITVRVFVSGANASLNTSTLGTYLDIARTS